jgi:hypothetical protein
MDTALILQESEVWHRKKSCEQQGNKGWGSVEGDLNRNPQIIQYTIGKNTFVWLFLGFFYDTLSTKDVFC